MVRALVNLAHQTTRRFRALHSKTRFRLRKNVEQHLFRNRIQKGLFQANQIPYVGSLQQTELKSARAVLIPGGLKVPISVFSVLQAVPMLSPTRLDIN